MKWKISTIILAVMLVMSSCGEASAEASDIIIYGFKMKEINCKDFFSNFELYYDTTTNIEYIVYKSDKGVAITPRYLNPGGSLYLKKE